MKKLIYLAAAIMMTVIGCSIGDDDIKPGPGLTVPKEGTGGGEDGPLQEITYHAFLAIDKKSYDHFGGEHSFQAKIDDFFRGISEHWNACAREDGAEGTGRNRFKYDFKFTADVGYVYEGSSVQSGLMNKIREQVDKNVYQYVVLLDLCKDHADESGAAYCGGIGNELIGVTYRMTDAEPRNAFYDQGNIGTMVHEIGHFRQVTDVYATASWNGWRGNPVNGVDFSPMDCIMNSGAKKRWSDYAVNIINEVALYPNPEIDLKREHPWYFKEIFCDRMILNIKINNKVPDDRITVKFYGKVGHADNNDGVYVVEQPYYVERTNANGVLIVNNVPEMYCEPYTLIDGNKYNIPGDAVLTWGRWFNFLVVFEYAGSDIGYIWIPEYDAQMTHWSDDAETLTINVNL